ncbi:CvpA family protein [Croceibacterium ferulae]|uniref:CvpA family protein n=1 Tax=Croceibacterium ferulae TaxID=1854641 RepID=UPI000EB31BD6|nr:CvpA family protein [Croceibacterium ferulae]
MTGFDIFALLVVGLSAIGGLSRGFVQEALSLAAWVVAIIAIRFFHTDLTQWLVDPIGSTSGAAVLAFALLLLVPYLGLRLLANHAGQTSRRSALAPFDRVLGFGFGMLKGFVIVIMAFSMLVLGYDTIWGAGGRPEWLTEARTYPLVNASADWMVNLIREQRAMLDGVEAAA